MKTNLILFVAIFAVTAADVSHITKKYLPPKSGKPLKEVVETTNKYLPPKATANDEVSNEYENNAPQIIESNVDADQAVTAMEQAAYQQAVPKQSSALTETQVTTTTFIPCSSINGGPCLPNNGFIQGFPGQYPGSFPGNQAGFPGQQVGFPGNQAGFPGQPGGFPGQQGGFPGQQGGFPGSPGGFYPGYGPGAYPGSNFGPAQNFNPYGQQNFLNRPGQFGPNYPGSVGPQVFPESFPGGFPPGPPGFIPGQNFAAGQNFEAGSSFIAGQNNLPGPIPGQGFYPGQNAYPRPPFAGNGFGFPMGGFFTDNGDNVSPLEENIPESFVRAASNTQYDDTNGGYIYEKPTNANLLL